LYAKPLLLSILPFIASIFDVHVTVKGNILFSLVLVGLHTTLGLGDRGEIYILPPERQPIKELKYRISTKAHQRIFSPD
jgi:hypothetical protein